jgi:protease II
MKATAAKTKAADASSEELKKKAFEELKKTIQKNRYSIRYGCVLCST